ncbi:hypothetical protein K503DRAFT_806820 [Rhizopogon vinicolor AM-OR11-026]|uniref:Uncharacterized protein n=1 Tax=Rhizopogon vinicolor AM-OR11-026 TaxID=1314800 RepID=A0A1B7MDQ8_9AGAM|nr:hypothetical protein K503DRAFT_806820 [Rhizopogon vinicolor AM-OR11-026]
MLLRARQPLNTSPQTYPVNTANHEPKHFVDAKCGNQNLRYYLRQDVTAVAPVDHPVQSAFYFAKKTAGTTKTSS